MENSIIHAFNAVQRWNPVAPSGPARYEPAKERRPKPRMSAVTSAYRLFSKEGNLNARRFYKNAIEIDPNYAAAYAGLAETYMHEWFRGSPDAVERAYELALRAHVLNPSLPIVWEALGNVQLFKRQHEEAVAAVKQWVMIEPGNAEAYANLAATLHFDGESEQVIQRCMFRPLGQRFARSRGIG